MPTRPSPEPTFGLSVNPALKAAGGVPQSVAGNQFTTEELRKLAKSAGGLRDWPKITEDPRVNFIVDCVVADEREEPAYDEQLYVAEIEAFRANGSFA